MYKELIEHNITNRGKVVAQGTITTAPRPYEAYASLYSFDRSIIDHIEATKAIDGKGSVSGYTGIYLAQSFVLDIDNEEEPAKAQASAREIIKRAYEKFELLPKNWKIYFSGNKGFHLELSQNLFGGFTPDRELPTYHKRMAALMITELFGSVSPARCYVDTKIFEGQRIFRLPNSRHKKTGLFKVPITYEQLNQLDIEQLKVFASQPNENFPHERESQLRVLRPLEQLYLSAQQSIPESGDNAVAAPGNGKYDTFFHIPSPGDRNNDLHKMASALFSYSDLSEKSVGSLVGIINQASPSPLDWREVNQLVGSAAKSRQRVQAKKEYKRQETRVNFMQAARDYVDYYARDYKPLQCLFERVDGDQELRLGGKLACFIGSAGTMKSYLVQNIIRQNVINNGSIVACASMEMSQIATTGRFLDLMSVDPEAQEESVSRVIRDNAPAAKEQMYDYLTNWYGKLEEKIHFESKSFTTVDDYDNWLVQIESTYGKPDILVVDGLSLMGGSGSEMDRYSENTADLKELAKKWDLFIPLICHTNKEADEFTRDSRPFARASGKILDNMDFCMCASKVINPGSTIDNIDAAEGKGHVFYYDKRGTGRVRRIVFDIHPYTNVITESSDDPTMYPEKDTLKKSKRHKPNDSVF